MGLSFRQAHRVAARRSSPACSNPLLRISETIVETSEGEDSKREGREDAGLLRNPFFIRSFHGFFGIDLVVVCQAGWNFVGHEDDEVVLEILADAGEVDLAGDVVLGEVRGGAIDCSVVGESVV